MRAFSRNWKGQWLLKICSKYRTVPSWCQHSAGMYPLEVQRVVARIQEQMAFFNHLPAEHPHEGKMFTSQPSASSKNLKPCVLNMQIFVGAHVSG